MLSLYDAFSGLVKHPYKGAKLEGPLGLGKGVGRGVWGFGTHTLAGKYTIMFTVGRTRTNVSAAIFGLPGYSLKGIERALSKHRLTTLQAELYLIRLRQAVRDMEKATPDERAEVIISWKRLPRR